MAGGRRADWIAFVMLVHHYCSCQGLVLDGEILLEFKSNVVDRLNSLVTWGSAGEDPCDGQGGSGWAGVTCNNKSGSGFYVELLELRSLSLESADVTVLANLANLHTLDLRDNSFSGKPPDLSKIQNLVFLYLGNNQFEGPLADRFPPKLRELDVQNNLFTGEIGTSNVFNLTLQRLDLHGNRFSGELPNMSFSGEGALRYFDVSGNQFEGPLPSALTRLDLLYCNMSGNRFRGEIQVDPITGWFPTGVLDLSKNRLSGIIPPKLFTSMGMTYLDLSHNELEGPVPTQFSERMRTRIQYLYLQNNTLTGDFYNLLRSNLSSLVELRLNGNGHKFHVSGARKRILSLMSTSLVNSFADCDFWNQTETFSLSADSGIVNLPRLRVLECSDCDLEGSLPADIFNPQTLHSLKILDSSENSLKGRIPEALRQIPLLRELRLGRNLLKGDMDKWVYSNWTNLEVLDISGNCVLFNTSKPIKEMLTFPRLKELRVGSNSIVRGIRLPALNGLKESFEDLEVLDLSQLYMNSNISSPYSSANVFPSLRYLDLSKNLLTGPVPDEFRQMPRLKHLNLANNWLSGKLPLFSPPLFDREFFTGNYGLCGPPLDLCSVPRLTLWKILLIVAISVVLSSVSYLVLGWIWRRRSDAKKHNQDAELIAALLDRDATTLMPLRELRKATNDFSDENQIDLELFTEESWRTAPS